MRQTIINLYTITELSGAARKRAVEWIGEGNTQDQWYDCEIEYWTEKLAEHGFDNAKIQFSGFWSQGDGASFEADINLEKFLCFPEFQVLKGEDINAKIVRYDTNYVHEKSCYVDLYFENESSSDMLKLLNKLRDCIEGERLSCCHNIYMDLGNRYDHLTSEPYCIECAMDNGYEFTGDGVIA